MLTVSEGFQYIIVWKAWCTSPGQGGRNVWAGKHKEID